ncbi:MAG TPA: ABC transporter ATP-binding protein [Acidimicrobiales bacterium]|nr:ABC transporter ATP-binding protein [Acidimicrobiales bacterium]
MVWAGGIAGGGGHHGPGQAANPGQGLPFAGIPPELQDGVDRLLEEEPDHGEPDVAFGYRPSGSDRRRLSLAGLIGRHRGLALWAVLLLAVVSLANQAGPLLIDYAINDGMAGNASRGARKALGAHPSPNQLEAFLHAHMHLQVVVAAALLYVLAIAVSAFAQRQQVRTTGRLAARVMNDLRVKVFAHLQRLGLDFYTDEKAGVVMTRMTSDIENLQVLLQDGLAQLLLQAMTMVVITALLFSMNVRLALITVALIVPLLTGASLWFRTASERGYQKVRDGIAAVLADLSENLHGIRVVAAHNRQAHNEIAHRNILGRYRDANNYTARVSAIYGPGTQMLGYLGQGALLAIGGSMVLHGSLALGDLVAFFLYLNRFVTPIQLLVQQYNTYQQGQSSIIKLRTLLAVEPSVAEAEDAVELPPIRGEIVFEDVCFGYDPATIVLRNVNLRIAAGETVAFVGPTGAGKSTLAKLVTRFYDPLAGKVVIDGFDLRRVKIASLRRQLGVVPQEPFLFAGSLADNIAFGRPDATREELWQAVRAVGLGDVVERMPDGLDTPVHERGQTLSSGERQLVALARAFVAQPRVVVLDEATSNLDLESEAKIEAALDRLLQGRTAVLIAHRLSTAMKADRIVVVDGGEIVESGTHAELVSAGGRYAEMYATWTSHLEGDPVETHS